MSATCSGWRSAAKANSEWIAASRGVAGPHAVAAVVFEMVEERSDHRCVQLSDVQAAR